VHHTSEELVEGLELARTGRRTARFRAVEDELRLAGFVTGETALTPAGYRYLADLSFCTTQGGRAA